MKAPRDMEVYHQPVKKGEEVKIKNIPWLRDKFSQSYLDFMDSLLNIGTKVLEFGSGGSSIYIAKRAGRITTFEDNEFWYKAVKEKIRSEKINNIDLIFDIDYPEKIPCQETRYDIAIVDIWVKPKNQKSLEKAIECVKRSGFLIFHKDSTMSGIEDRLRKANWNHIKSWGNWKTAWQLKEASE